MTTQLKPITTLTQKFQIQMATKNPANLTEKSFVNIMVNSISAFDYDPLNNVIFSSGTFLNAIFLTKMKSKNQEFCSVN